MSVAKSYAQALLQATTERSASGEQQNVVEQQLDQFLELIGEADQKTSFSKELRIALISPLATTREKSAIVQAVSEKAAFAPIVAQFLQLLARKGRLGLAKEIRDAFSEARLLADGGVQGRLVVADPIGQSDIEGLSSAFSKKLGKKVAFRVSTDPSLLAGMKVTVNGITYDGSLRSQLHRLRDKITEQFAEA